MFTNNFDPVAFEIFSLSIRWYSLSYIFGLIFGWTYCKKTLIKDNKIKILFDDYISYSKNYVIAYKPNLSFFEALGINGLQLLKDLEKMIFL